MIAWASIVKMIEDHGGYLSAEGTTLCKAIYEKVKDKEDNAVPWDIAFNDHKELLRSWEARNLIRGRHAQGGKEFFTGIELSNPLFLLRIFHVSEGDDRLTQLCGVFGDEISERPRSVSAKDVAASAAVPLPIVNALFECLQSDGQGFCSGLPGNRRYRSK